MNRAWYKHIDWSILLAWAALVSIGLTAIYSTTHGPAAEFLLESVQRNFNRQAMWFGISAFVFLAILLIPARVIEKGAWAAYVVSLGLLAAALFFGQEVNGAKSWLRFGGFSLQVSELAKAGTLLAVARFLETPQARSGRFRYVLVAVAIILLPAVMIVAQNDTGTALVFVAMIPVVLFWSGVPLRLMALLVSPAVVGYLAVFQSPGFPTYALIAALLFTAGMLVATRDKWLTSLALAFTVGTAVAVWVGLTKVLEPHQIDRIVAFTNPEAFRLTTGFHVIQSKAAVGSGGLFGKGFMQGTQTQLAFIPEQSTDFVFTIIGEEWGFIGAMVLLSIFGYLLIRLSSLGSWAAHPFPKVFAAGTAGIFLTHLLINMGMTIGLMPVIGIPLPLVSYGGSALLANTALIAVAVNLYARRDEFSIYRT